MPSACGVRSAGRRQIGAQVRQPLGDGLVAHRLVERRIDALDDRLRRPLGENSAVHAMVCSAGKPASVEDGTFGMAAARLGAVTAIGFTPPERMCGVAETT